MSLVSQDRSGSILSIQGSRDLVPLMVGQSWDVLSIPGYFVFKDPGM